MGGRHVSGEVCGERETLRVSMFVTYAPTFARPRSTMLWAMMDDGSFFVFSDDVSWLLSGFSVV